MNITQLRSHRINGIALFDLLGSIVIMVVIFLWRWKTSYPNRDWRPFVVYGLLTAIPVGIVFHVIFGIDTKLNYTLGLSNKPI